MRTFAYAVVRASSESSCSCDSIAILCQFEIDSPLKANFHPASIGYHRIILRENCQIRQQKLSYTFLSSSAHDTTKNSSLESLPATSSLYSTLSTIPPPPCNKDFSLERAIAKGNNKVNLTSLSLCYSKIQVTPSQSPIGWAINMMFPEEMTTNAECHSLCITFYEND